MSEITEEELRQLYLHDWVEIEDIAEHFGLSSGTSLYHWLEKYDIPRRNHLQVGISHDQEWGYEHFQENDSGTTVRHHRLLAMLKYEIEELDGKHIHHKNGIPWDNRLENLELMEPGEHSSLHQKGKSQANEHLKKLTDSQVVEIIEQYEDEDGTTYKELADQYNVSEGHVGRLVRGDSERVKSIEALQ